MRINHNNATPGPTQPTDTVEPSQQHSNGHQNGHVSPIERAQSEPYFNESPFIAGVLADDHRGILKNESGLSDEAIEARGYWTCDGDKATLRYLNLPTNIGRCLIIPLWNRRGERVGLAARPDIPILQTTGRTPKYLMPKGAPQVVDVSPLTRHLIDDPNIPAIATEGAKKADAGAELGFPSINLNGVFGYRGTNDKNGIANLADWDEIVFAGKDAKGQKFGRVLLICFDSDVTVNPKVEKGLRRFAALAWSRGAIVKIVQFEPGPNGEKTGLDDFKKRGGTREKLLSMARDLEPLQESRRKRKEELNKAKDAAIAARGLPQIETKDRQLIDELNDFSNALARYNEIPTLFRGIGGLKEIGRSANGEAILESVSRERLQVIASQAATWVSVSEREGKREVDPPAALCQQFLVSPDLWQGIPVIRQIITTPFVDRHGDICAAPGYHASEQVYLSLPDGFALPDTTPTPASVVSAKDLLINKLLGEVDFEDQASRANAVALMILPAVRRVIQEQTPLHLGDAPTQNSGKTYLMQICLSPYCEAVPTSDKADQKESQKEIFALLMEGWWYIFIDNVKSSLESPEIATAITSGKMRGRILGVSKTESVASDVVWIATSNNAQLDADIVSRCIIIRLDTNLESPDTRVFNFDPLRFVAANRAQVLGAILTIVRAWLESGRPMRVKKSSRFPAWEAIIGGILEGAGIDGFLDNHIEARNMTDPETQSWRAFVDAWFAKHGDSFVTVKELLEVDSDSELLSCIGEKDRGKRFGKELQKRRDKVISGLKITRKAERTRLTEWRLVPVLKSDNLHKEHKVHKVLTHAETVQNPYTQENMCIKEENANNIAGLEHCADYALCAGDDLDPFDDK